MNFHIIKRIYKLYSIIHKIYHPGFYKILEFIKVFHITHLIKINKINMLHNLICHYIESHLFQDLKNSDFQKYSNTDSEADSCDSEHREAEDTDKQILQSKQSEMSRTILNLFARGL